MKMANAMELLNLERNAACGRRTGTCRHSCSNDFSPSRAIYCTSLRLHKVVIIFAAAPLNTTGLELGRRGVHRRLRLVRRRQLWAKWRRQ